MALKHWLGVKFSKQSVSFGKRRPKWGRGLRTFKPFVEALEDRLVPTGFVVNDLQDAAQLTAGTNNATDVNNQVSLRSAIAAANFDAQNGVADTITFNSSLAGKTITLGSTLELSGVPSSGSATITIDASSLTSGITVSGNNQVSVFLVDPGVNALFNGLTIADGLSASGGGGIDNSGGTLTVQNCNITDNSTPNADGGGISNGNGNIFSNSNAILSLQNCNITGNSAPNGKGGGIYNFVTINNSVNIQSNGILTVQNCNITGNSAQSGVGGGIFNSGAVTVTGSTLSGNSADFGGGGTYNQAVAVTSLSGGVTIGVVTLIDSTLSGNSATSGDGGGIYNDKIIRSAAKTTVINCTVSGNTAQDGGGIYNDDPAAGLTLQNAIVAGNTATGGLGSDIDNNNTGISSVNYSMIGNTTESGLAGGAGNILNPAFLGLGPLGNYGGTTETISLLPGSPAIDTGSNSLAVDAQGNPLATDQRGQPRIVNGVVDMGAFEAPPSSAVSIRDLEATVANGPDGAFQVGRFDPSGELTVTVAITASTAPNYTLSAGTGIDPSAFHFDSATQAVTFTVAAGVALADVNVEGIDPTHEADAINNSLQVTLQSVSGSGNSGAYTIYPNNATATVALGGSGLLVTNTNASGDGSLMQAVLNDNGLLQPGLITFAAGLSGTITLAATLELSNLHSNAANPEEIDGQGAGNLTISGNHSVGVVAVDAGVIALLSGLTIADGDNTTSGGGGIYNAGTLTVFGSTLDDNSANSGGGIYNKSGTATVINSTLSGNSAPSGDGGGIYNSSSTVLVTNSTLNGNSAEDGGGIFNDDASVLTLQNTIVAGNTAPTANDVEGNTGGSVSASYSMIGDDTNSTITSNPGNILNPAFLGLGTLGNYGGTTDTIPLISGSPAIDAGSNSLAVDAQGNPLATDQRGDARIVDGTVDIGAFETLPSGTVILSALPPVANNPGGVFQVSRFDNSGALTATVVITVSTAPSYTLSAGTGIDPATFSFDSTTDSVTFTFVAGAAAADIDVGGIGTTTEADAETYSLEATLQSVSGSSNSGAYVIDPGRATATVAVGGTGLVVTNSNASGDGSLTQAVLNDNALSQPGTIIFSNGLSGTITLGANLALSNLNSNAANTEEIEGPGATTLTISGSAVLVDAGVTAVIAGLTIDSFDNNSSALTAESCTFEVGSGTFSSSAGGTFTGGTVFNVAQSATGLFQANGSFTNGAIFNVAQGASLNLSTTLAFSGGTVFNLAPAATVNVNSGTFTGGISFNFNVTQAGAVNLNDGQFSGTLTGTGLGTVELDPDRLYLGNAGATLDFPGNMLQWTSGVIDAGNGNLTNLGTMTLAGTGPKDFYNDGVLDNFGTIIQTGTGDLMLGTDNVFPAILKIEPGASYLIEGDSGIGQVQDHVGTAAFPSIDNSGSLVKTAGAGTSTLTLSGSITNTGTIEVDSGTLFLDAAIMAQVSGTTLTGGTWSALGGATLELQSGTAITSNEAIISLAGSGAAITGLGGLASNSGSFSLSGGATFAATGDFANSGTLSVGAGCILKVAANFSQTSAGTLLLQIGGTPASGDLGLIAAVGTASLAGDFSLSLINNFTPSLGQSFLILTFSGSTGNFTVVQNLGAFNEVLNPTDLELDVLSASADLAANDVSVPTTATIGQNYTVSWQVINQGNASATGSWQDAVYVSTTPTLSLSATLLGITPYSGGLAVGAAYDATLTMAFPALLGQFYVFVVADNDQQVPVSNRADTIAVAANTVQSDARELPLSSSSSGTLAQGQSIYYRVDTVAGENTAINLSGNNASAINELYASLDSLPTRGSYNFAYSNPSGAGQEILIPADSFADTYYILIYGRESSAAQTYTISAAVPTFSVTGADLSRVGNTGSVTFKISGSGFDSAATFQLNDAGGNAYRATQQVLLNSTSALATFNLTGAAAGAASITVSDDGVSLSVADATTIVAGGGGKLSINLNAPGTVRTGRVGVWTVQYANTGDSDLPVPVLFFGLPGATFLGTSPDGNNLGNYAFLLGVPQGDFYDVLRPGESGSVTFYAILSSTTQSFLTTINPNAAVLSQIPLTYSTPQLGANYATMLAGLQEQLTQLATGPARYQDVTNVNGVWSSGPQPIAVGAGQENDGGSGGGAGGAGAGSGGAGGAPSGATTQVVILDSYNYSGLTAPNPSSSLSNLSGNPSTAQGFYNYFTNYQGVPAGNVQILSNPSLSTFQSTLNGIAPGGNIVIVQLGHGDTNGNYLFTDGTSLANGATSQMVNGMQPGNLSQMVNDLQPSQSYYFLGGCYSGANTGPLLTGNSAVFAATGPTGIAMNSSNGNVYFNTFLNTVEQPNPPSWSAAGTQASMTASQNSLSTAPTTTMYPAGTDVSVTQVPAPNGNGTVQQATLQYSTIDKNGVVVDHTDVIQGSTLTTATDSNGNVSVVYSQNENQFQTANPPQSSGNVNVGVNPLNPAAQQQDSPQNGLNENYLDSGDSNNLIQNQLNSGFGPAISQDTSAVSAMDPNSLVGPAGYAAANFIPATTSNLGYTVHFQNDPTATAAAQTVSITANIDPSLDPSSVRLGSIGFGTTFVAVPLGLTYYQTQLDLTAQFGVDVDVTAAVDVAGRQLTWLFTTIDPATGLPTTNPLQGFLPPDDSSGDGEGFVTFYAQPEANLPANTTINESASVVFDTNAAIPTNAYTNTIDNVAPTSSVSSLPAFSPASFTVSWSGQDNAGGSGIATFAVYVSDKSAPFALWQSFAASQTSAVFTGTQGQTYAFYSVATDNVGNVQITPPNGQASTYVQMVPAVTAVDASGLYKGTPYTAGGTATGTGGVTVSGTFTFTYTNTQDGSSSSTAPTNVGSYTVVAHFSSTNSNYSSPDSQPTAFSIGQVTLTVSATGTQIYGAASPTLTPSYKGFVNNETAASALTGSPSLSATTTATTSVGQYTITVTQGSLSAGNYSFLFQNGTLQVTAATLTVSATGTQTYGAANPTLTATYSGFVNNQTAAVLTGSPSLSATTTATSSVGQYTIAVAKGSLSDANYSFVFNNGTFQVTPATLTVSATGTQTYGAASPTLTATYSGFVNSQTVSILTGSPSLSATTSASSPVGQYTITVAKGSLSVGSNYSLAFQNGTLQVTAATLTVSAAGTQTYGAASPTLTATYSGFVNNQTASVLTGSPSLSATTTATSPVGQYAITVTKGTLSDANYSFVFKNGTLQVTAATLTVSATGTQTYGAASPTLTASYSGFVNGQTAAVLTGSPSLSTSVTAASPVGQYTITVAVGSLSDGNYSFVFKNGTLQVTAATLTVSATGTQTYGAASPTLTATYSGFVNGQTTSILTGSPSLSAGTNATSPVGQYTITVAKGSLSGANYSFVFANGTLQVTPAVLTVTANNQTIIAGAAVPTLTFAIAGFVNGETQSGAVSGAPSLSTTATSSSAPNTYTITITQGTLKAANYSFKFVNGTLTINPAPILATQLAFTAPPATAFAGFNLNSPGGVQVSVEDKSGHVQTGDTSSVTVAIASGPTGGTFIAGSILSAKAQSGVASFAQLAFNRSGTYTLKATDTDGSTVLTPALATVVINPNTGLFLLDADGQSLTASGNAVLKVTNDGAIGIESDIAGAALASGNASVTASEIDTAGGLAATGNGAFHGTVVPVTPSTILTLAGYLSAPPEPANNFNASSYCGTLSPGTYMGGLNVIGNNAVTLKPGTYYLNGGGLTLSGNATLTGTGVLIYITGLPGNTPTAVNITGNANATLTPLTSGTYQGVSLYVCKTTTATINVSGTGILNTTGTVYAPKSTINLSGNASLTSLGAEWIVSDLSLSGNAQFNISANANNRNQDPNAFLVAGGPVSSAGSVAVLTVGEVDVAFQAALALWAGAGLDAGTLAAISRSVVKIAPLPAPYLGLAAPGVIYLDPTAEGFGWFSDVSTTASPPKGAIDLLTVMAHEMGHLFGLADGNGTALMSQTLTAGVRMLPNAGDLLAPHMTLTFAQAQPGQDDGSNLGANLRSTVGNDPIALAFAEMALAPLSQGTAVAYTTDDDVANTSDFQAGPASPVLPAPQTETTGFVIGTDPDTNDSPLLASLHERIWDGSLGSME